MNKNALRIEEVFHTDATAVKTPAVNEGIEDSQANIKVRDQTYTGNVNNEPINNSRYTAEVNNTNIDISNLKYTKDSIMTTISQEEVSKNDTAIENIAISFIQSTKERDGDTTTDYESSDESQSILIDYNTEDIDNISVFEKDELAFVRNDSENLKELFREDHCKAVLRDKTPSPVLNIKTKKVNTPKTPQSLSEELEDIANFDKKVVSLVENINNQIVKNSQTLSNESHTCRNIHKLHVSKRIIDESITYQNAIKLNPDKENDINNGNTFEKVFVNDEENYYGHVEGSDLLLTPTRALNSPFDEDPYSLAKTMYVGFQTVSNKSIQIQTETLKNARRMLNKRELSLTELVEMIDGNDNKTIDLKAQNDLPNKKIKLTDDLPIKDLHKEQNHTEISEKQTGTEFVGFRTANNNKIAISNKAMARTTNIFKDIDLTEKYNHSEVDLNIKNNELLIKNRRKTNTDNKNTNIQEENNINDDLLIKEFENIEMSLEKIEPKVKTDFKGFKTASNKTIQISSNAMKNVNNIFKDLDINELNEDANNNEDSAYPSTSKSVKNTENKSFSNLDLSSTSKDGFKTANYKLSDMNDMNVIKSYTDTNKVKNVFGFQTASKKPVYITEESLIHSKKLLQDITEKTNKDIINNSKKTNSVQTLPGFQTASNKNVKISKESIEKTKHIFKDINIHINNKGNSQETTNNLHTENTTPVVPDNNKNSHIDKLFNKFKRIVNITLDVIVQLFKESMKNELKRDISTNIDVDTQTLNNFEQNLCTEDFQSTPKTKRSASPVLSCPSVKKRKFETNQSDIGKYEAESGTFKPNYFNENYKKNKYKLKDLKIINKTIDSYLTNFNLDNILNFEFDPERNDITDTKMTINDIKSIFLIAVDTKIVPDGWLDIHLKLILWKLLSYEVKYNYICTVREVLNQLKYRYDKELYRTERPALRKILEKDDIPSKTLVLCVAGVFIDGVSVQNANKQTQHSTDNIELLLTDGWYFIKATIDKMLSRLVCQGNISIGCKIVTNGAEILNCEQGISPWEDTSSVRLKLFGNSTRPAPWDTNLGYHNSVILSNLTSVKVDGGKICKINVYVTRVYPLLYVEKFDDGSTVTRSERLEHLHQIKYENEREPELEKIYEEVQKEFSDQESQGSENDIEPGSKRKVYDTGSQIAKMMKRSEDPMEFRAQLTSSQIQLLQDHTSKHRDKLITAIQNKIKGRLGERNVVMLAKGRIASVGTNGDVTTAMLSIWKPSDAILELFKENTWIEIRNVVPTALRYSEMQLSAGRQSLFRESKQKNKSHIKHLEKYKRKIYNIEDLTKKPVNDYEIDTFGLIFLIDPPKEEFDSTKYFQNVYLTDENKNMICICFWGGIEKFGFHNVINKGQIISCANLQKRAGNIRKNIPQFRVTELTNITKTPKNMQCREMIDDLNKKLGLDRVKFCEDCVAVQKNYKNY